ncbi:MAG TPA: OmpA family protein [Rhizomicrobium sp.]
MTSRHRFGAALIALLCASTAALAQATPDQSLLQPGQQPDNTAPIHLHMPGTPAPEASVPTPSPTHHARHKAAPRAPASVDAIGAEAPIPPASSSSPKTRHTGKAAPAQVAIPFTFGEEEPLAPSVPPPPAATPSQASAPRPLPAAKIHPAVTAIQPPSVATRMTNEPNRATNDRRNLAKRGAVMFEKGMSDPSPEQYRGVKLLAGDLSAALEAGASRVQLEAYGGAPGDKSSDARRLSLKRALAVRQLLIDNGVPSARIDVRAMGGIDDKGPADRVDVFVRAG